jgi:peptidoglycan/xylan/chitin deacetylase (PgdA/CDA1 family)
MKFVNNKPTVIFTFHHVSPYKDTLTISPKLFKKTLEYIGNEFNIISQKEFYKYLFKNLNFPQKSALITFDDGYLDNFIYAYPIIKELKIPVTIFLITNMIEKSSKILRKEMEFTSHLEIEKNMKSKYFINLVEAKEMEKSGLITFDSHTKTHYSCNENNLEKIEDELSDSLNFIQKNFPKRFYSLCWPKGKFSEDSKRIAKKVGYSFAFSTIDGPYTKGEDLFSIKRVDISSSKNGSLDYLKRLKKKSKLYSIPFISKIYSDYKYLKRKKW